MALDSKEKVPVYKMDPDPVQEAAPLAQEAVRLVPEAVHPVQETDHPAQAGIRLDLPYATGLVVQMTQMAVESRAVVTHPMTVTRKTWLRNQGSPRA
jgi:hypothetical protein